MSLSVTQFPMNNTSTMEKLMSPAYNEVIYVVHESASGTLASPNFKYICKIYDSANTTLLATIKHFPLADGYCVFDLHRILENFLSYDILYNDTGFLRNTNSHFDYKVRFGEEYGSPPVETMLLNDNVTKGVLNQVYDFPDFANFLVTHHNSINFNGGHWLSNAPLTRDIRTTEQAWLYVAQCTNIIPDQAINYLQVISYNTNGGTTTNTIANSFISGSTSANCFLRVAVGFYDLQALGYVGANTEYYTVQALGANFGGSPGLFGDIYTFNVIRCDPKYQLWRLHFLNKLGGFDSFTFSKVSHQTGEIERQMYKQVYGTESGGAWSYQQSDRQMTQFDTKAQTKYSLQSDWVSDAQYQWLKELLTSPVVFYQSTGGAKFIAVNIETSSYEIKKKINEKVINLQIEISLSYDEYRQRG